MSNNFQIIEGFASTDAKPHYPPNLQLEPIHQAIKLTFNLEKKIAWGSVTTTIRANSDNATTIKFDAIDFTIKSVQGADSYSYDGEKVTMTWNTAWKRGQIQEIVIQYSIEEPLSGLYFSYPDDKYPNRIAYVVTDHETERARYHIPCIDHPAIRCSIDFYLTANEKYTILANGRLIEEGKNGDGTKTAHWKQKFPCPSYLITYAIGEFVNFTDSVVDAGKGSIPIAYFTTNDFTSEALKRTFDRTPEMLEWMTKKFKCPLEWDKYYQIITPHYAGAMENISMVTWGSFALLHTEDVAKELWWRIDAINVHEMSHSWFGDMIVIREFTHGWLKESWAVYTESCYYEDTRDEDEWKYNMYNNSLRYREESDSKYARPIVNKTYDSSWDMYDRHLYPGGAWRIHMLRHLIKNHVSDECFWEAVSDYLNTYKGKVVETIDFQRKLEEHSGLSLQSFFDQWLYSPGYPKLKVKFNFDEKSHLASLKLDQTQIDEKKNIGVFQFPLEIMWETENGSFEREKFIISEKVQTLYFKCVKKPKQIRIDPDYVLLCSLEFNPGTDMLKQQLKTGDSIAKIQAAKELTKTGKKKDLETVFHAYRDEKYWGTKVELAKLLKESPSLYGMRLLRDLLEDESDPLVLTSLIHNFANVREFFVFDAMKNYLKRPVHYPYATATALEVIGTMRTDEAYKFLNTYSPPKDPKNIVKSGLYRAIGSIRTEQALEYLVKKIPYGEDAENCRSSIASALISSLSWMKESVRNRYLEKLTDIIPGETNELFLHNLARIISTVKDPLVITALKTIKRKLAKQDKPEIDRLIQKVQKSLSTEEEIRNLKSEIDSVKKSLKNLKEVVEKIEARTAPEKK
ncbi:MAG: M1 family metallopeptidase [Candidatus Lokiarchaeota archaeon]|nr:M1 family metallopeptidase [Candidatus Lokiarchaeota archaeon]